MHNFILSSKTFYC